MQRTLLINASRRQRLKKASEYTNYKVENSYLHCLRHCAEMRVESRFLGAFANLNLCISKMGAEMNVSTFKKTRKN